MSQRGSDDGQSASDVHSAQRPRTQRAAAAGQSAFVAHLTQRRVTKSQMGSSDRQSVF